MIDGYILQTYIFHIFFLQNINIYSYIATGDVNGYVKFYDKTLKILYWYQGFSLEGIIAIEFNLSKRKIQAEGNTLF